MKRTSLWSTVILLAALLAAPLACGGEEGSDDDQSTTQTDDALYRGGYSNTGDSCEYPGTCPSPPCMSLPGTENGAGQCCRNTNPTDCVPILKPFPGGGIYIAH